MVAWLLVVVALVALLIQRGARKQDAALFSKLADGLMDELELMDEYKAAAEHNYNAATELNEECKRLVYRVHLLESAVYITAPDSKGELDIRA
jgi:hypothetical protein